jgi:hypothetical protein
VVGNELTLNGSTLTLATGLHAGNQLSYTIRATATKPTYETKIEQHTFSLKINKAPVNISLSIDD